MSWYKTDRSAWKEIIETVAAEEHRTTQMIEKDTIQSMFLLELAKSELPFISTITTKITAITSATPA